MQKISGMKVLTHEQTVDLCQQLMRDNNTLKSKQLQWEKLMTGFINQPAAPAASTKDIAMMFVNGLLFGAGFFAIEVLFKVVLHAPVM